MLIPDRVFPSFSSYLRLSSPFNMKRICCHEKASSNYGNRLKDNIEIYLGRFVPRFRDEPLSCLQHSKNSAENKLERSIITSREKLMRNFRGVRSSLFSFPLLFLSRIPN